MATQNDILAATADFVVVRPLRPHRIVNQKVAKKRELGVGEWVMTATQLASQKRIGKREKLPFPVTNTWR